MAAVVVQSRFAGLKIEDDDFSSPRDNEKAKKTKPKANVNNVKKPDTTTKKINNSKPQNGALKKKKTKGNPQTAVQWEQWKQKDEQLVDGNYESELHQAILLSKLDFEEKKDVYKQLKKEADIEKKMSEQTAKTGNKKQKKKNVMSLDQFNDMMSSEDNKNHTISTDNGETQDLPKSPGKDTEFFERVKDETKHELLKDKINDRVRHRKPLSDEIINRAQFLEALEKKDKEITSLKHDVTCLKEELLTVKSRNKKLCNILGQGEMKDKAEVLVEVERLRGVQAELTAEVSALHTELERERSKNTDPRTKDKKKKGANIDKEK